MTPKEKAQARLNKVARLYEGAKTDGEREAAFTKMRQIMDEWDLEVKDEEKEFQVVEQRFGIYGSYAALQRALVSALCKYMNCVAVKLTDDSELVNESGKKSADVLAIFGTERDLAFLAELHKLIWEQCLRSKAKADLKGRSGHHSYVLGFVVGVTRQVNTIIEARKYETNTDVTAIVVQKDVQARRALFKEYPKTITHNYAPKFSDGEAVAKGKADGEKANISNHVTTGAKGLPNG